MWKSSNERKWISNQLHYNIVKLFLLVSYMQRFLQWNKTVRTHTFFISLLTGFHSAELLFSSVSSPIQVFLFDFTVIKMHLLWCPNLTLSHMLSLNILYLLVSINDFLFWFHLGFTASTISFPLEVARKRLMVGALQGKCPPNMAAALSEVIREEGLKGLYRGWGASCLKVMPSSGITWMFYEAWKDILLVQNGNPF